AHHDVVDHTTYTGDALGNVLRLVACLRVRGLAAQDDQRVLAQNYDAVESFGRQRLLDLPLQVLEVEQIIGDLDNARGDLERGDGLFPSGGQVGAAIERDAPGLNLRHHVRVPMLAVGVGVLHDGLVGQCRIGKPQD